MAPLFTSAPLQCRGVFLPGSADALPHLSDSLAAFTGCIPHLLPQPLIAPVSPAFQGFSPLFQPSSPLPPGISGGDNQVAGAEQIGAAVAHLELQLVQVAVHGGVVAGEAVAAHILPPGACQAVPAGSLTHLAPVPQPLRRADALWGRAAVRRAAQYPPLSGLDGACLSPWGVCPYPPKAPGGCRNHSRG